MRARLLILAAVLSSLLGCEPPAKAPSLTDSGRMVHVGKSDPPSGAREIGPMTSADGEYCSGGEDGTYKHALVRLRNRAATKGANYVQVMTLNEPHQDTRHCYDHRFVIHAMLYDVPALPGSSAPEAESDACNPPCSPGFTCDDGACEPVCNPECGAGQVCRPDRTCGPAPVGEPTK